jgi:hypothetical protein
MSRRGGQPAKEFSPTDLDELLNATLNEVDDDLDMNDPDLLVRRKRTYFFIFIL